MGSSPHEIPVGSVLQPALVKELHVPYPRKGNERYHMVGSFRVGRDTEQNIKMERNAALIDSMGARFCSRRGNW